MLISYVYIFHKLLSKETIFFTNVPKKNYFTLIFFYLFLESQKKLNHI